VLGTDNVVETAAAAGMVGVAAAVEQRGCWASPLSLLQRRLASLAQDCQMQWAGSQRLTGPIEMGLGREAYQRESLQTVKVGVEVGTIAAQRTCDLAEGRCTLGAGSALVQRACGYGMAGWEMDCNREWGWAGKHAVDLQRGWSGLERRLERGLKLAWGTGCAHGEVMGMG
jgi:hypothetical protein